MTKKFQNASRKNTTSKKAQSQIECLTLKRMLFGNMTYAQFASKLGISENNLIFKINGKRRWWLEECILAAQLLKVADLKEVFPEIFETFRSDIA